MSRKGRINGENRLIGWMRHGSIHFDIFQPYLQQGSPEKMKVRRGVGFSTPTVLGSSFMRLRVPVVSLDSSLLEARALVRERVTFFVLTVEVGLGAVTVWLVVVVDSLVVSFFWRGSNTSISLSSVYVNPPRKSNDRMVVWVIQTHLSTNLCLDINLQGSCP